MPASVSRAGGMRGFGRSALPEEGLLAGWLAREWQAQVGEQRRAIAIIRTGHASGSRLVLITVDVRILEQRGQIGDHEIPCRVEVAQLDLRAIRRAALHGGAVLTSLGVHPVLPR